MLTVDRIRLALDWNSRFLCKVAENEVNYICYIVNLPLCPLPLSLFTTKRNSKRVAVASATVKIYFVVSSWIDMAIVRLPVLPPLSLVFKSLKESFHRIFPANLYNTWSSHNTKLSVIVTLMTYCRASSNAIFPWCFLFHFVLLALKMLNIFEMCWIYLKCQWSIDDSNVDEPKTPSKWANEMCLSRCVPSLSRSTPFSALCTFIKSNSA